MQTGLQAASDALTTWINEQGVKLEAVGPDSSGGDDGLDGDPNGTNEAWTAITTVITTAMTTVTEAVSAG